MMTHSGDIRFKVKSLGFIVEHLCSTIYFLLHTGAKAGIRSPRA